MNIKWFENTGPGLKTTYTTLVSLALPQVLPLLSFVLVRN